MILAVQYNRIWRTILFLALGFILMPTVADETLRSQLETMARENGIRIEGLDRVSTEPAKQVEGDLAQRINSLLSDYNFLTVGQGGKIESLTITSLKHLTVKPRNSGAVKTRRLGVHHQVRAALYGPDNTELDVTLLVDTGATTLVLPESMIGALGFKAGELQNGVSQTAAGSVPIKIGVLKSVRVGNVAAENIAVSFIDDKKLNNAQLLGMSFLSRFKFSLDDEKSELILLPK